MAAAAAFVGMAVKLTLKEPPGTILHGTVAQVVPETSTLRLEHVSFPQTGQKCAQWHVIGIQIENLEIIQAADAASAFQPLHDTSQPGVQSAAQPEASIPIPVQTPQQDFVDPAILSFGTNARPQSASTKASGKGRESVQEAVSRITATYEINRSTINGNANLATAQTEVGTHSGTLPVRAKAGIQRGSNVAATLTAPFSGLDNGNAPNESLLEETDGPPLPQDHVRRVSLNKTRSGKPADDPGPAPESKRKTRRGVRRVKNDSTPPQEGQQEMPAHGQSSSPEVVRRSNGNMFRGKGWRQTPILQDSHSGTPKSTGIANHVGPQVASSAARRGNRKQKAMELEAERNGWATEDATDIQELPEFDFASNLSKFDKKSVFDQIRNDDETADSDRLVNFNRLPRARPGTYGGKNLHHTENVLDSPRVRSRRQSAASSDSDMALEFAAFVSRRNTSKTSSSMKDPTRSNSGVHDSIHLARGGPRPMLGPGFPGSLPHTAPGSPNLNRSPRPKSPSLASQLAGDGQLRIVGSDRACPTITPGGMAAVEEVAETEFGLTAEVMNENAGRGIAEVAMQALDPTGRRMARDNVRLNSLPLALCLVGNHRAGARALVAARHLRGRGVRVVVCILGIERPNLEMEKSVRKQVDVLVKLGAVVRGWPEVRDYLTQTDRSHGQPELVVDALLAPAKPYDALKADDQRAAADMISWVNRGTGRIVLSVDVPSGINGSTGESDTVLDCGDPPMVAAPLEVRAKHIVCIGAPRVGVLRALQRGLSNNNSSSSSSSSSSAAVAGGLHEQRNWQLWAVDIGVNRAWKLYGVPGGAEGGVKFGSEWVVQLAFVGDDM